MAKITLTGAFLRNKKRKITYTQLYDMYYERCVGRIVRLFKWSNLPFPQHELEIRTILSGYGAVVMDGKRGIMTAWGGMSGPTQYADYFKKFTYAAPTADGGSKIIGKECVILRNDQLSTSMADWIKRYAELYTHNDLSLRMALINSRYQDILKTTDSAKSDTLKEWYKGLERGELCAIIDDSPLSEFMGKNGDVSTLDLTHTGEVDFTRHTELENELTRAFYRDIGIRWNKDKKANLVAGEVEQDDMMLEFNICDMLDSRERFCNEYNTVFGGDITVELRVPLENDTVELTQPLEEVNDDNNL